eukprot:GFKZ01003035.1.p1 GENE.GFKZ01003035.1~~GFKZ01003035.1.p1  ORF type:complete len:656 (+),score=64.24 GFKZ01003035.1:257-1969(+)
MLRAALLFAAALASVASAALRICHTNDFHAKYNEVGEQNVNCKWFSAIANECYSGIARLTTAMRSLKCDLKIQAGDWVQGSLLDTVFHENIAIPAYTWVKYDIATMGNHEFDTGPSLINTTIRATSPDLTWLSSNVEFKDPTMTDLPLHKSLDRKGVCWVASTTATTAFTSSPGETVVFHDEAESMRKAITMCEQQDNVIAITHNGYDEDLQMCHDVPEIDLIIGGHTHTDMSDGKYPVKVEREDGSVCWVTQTFAHGRYIGVLDLYFQDGVIHFTTTSYLATDFRIARDPSVLLKLQLFNNQVAARVDEVIGHAEEIIVGGSAPCRGGTECGTADDHCECSMGNLVCDSMVEWVETGSGGPPVLCIMNGGSFRNSIEKGDIKIRDVVNVLPFGNTIVAYKMTGAQVIDILQYAIGGILPGRQGGSFLGGLGNLVVTAIVDESAPDASQVVIKDVQVNGKPLQSDDEYTVLTNSYVASGGDGYVWPGEGEDLGVMLREAMQAYLEAHNPYSPVIGRLHISNPGGGLAASVGMAVSEDTEREEVSVIDVQTEGASRCDDDNCAGPEKEIDV